MDVRNARRLRASHQGEVIVEQGLEHELHLRIRSGR